MSSASLFSLSLLRRIYALLTPRQRSQGALTVVGIVFGGLLDVLGLAAILPVISIAVTPELVQENATVAAVYEGLGFQSETQFLAVLVLLMFSAFLLKNAIGLWLNFWQVRYTFEVAKSLSQRMFLLYFQRGYSFVRSIESGAFISNIKNVPSVFALGVLLPLISLFSELFVVFVILGVVWFTDPRMLTMLAILVGGGFVIVSLLVRRKLAKINQERAPVIAKSISRINESFQGFVEILLNRKERFFMEKFMSASGREYDLIRDMSFYNLLPARANEVVIIAGISLIFIYGLFVLEERKQFFFMLGMMAVAAYRIMPSMNRIMQSIVSINTGSYSCDILQDAATYQEQPEHNTSAVSFQREIKVKNLSYAYPGAEKPVLNQLDFEIRKSETIGFIGESGSGKSTIMRLLLRLIEETTGEILVDGVKLDSQNAKSWQSGIGYVQQDIFLIDGTIAENVALGEPIEEIDVAKLENSLKRAGLASFVASLAEGSNSYIGEYGSFLSGGQKQRIAIARALYKDAEFFIFDEATSALDAETEQMICESIKMLSEDGKTIAIIAHRLTTLKDCDRIYELERGNIAAVHRYDELIQMKLGLVRSDNE